MPHGHTAPPLHTDAWTRQEPAAPRGPGSFEDLGHCVRLHVRTRKTRQRQGQWITTPKHGPSGELETVAVAFGRVRARRLHQRIMHPDVLLADGRLSASRATGRGTLVVLLDDMVRAVRL